METPDRKVSVGAIAIGAPAGIILQWLLGQFGVDMPAEVATACGSLISAVAAYFVPNK